MLSFKWARGCQGLPSQCLKLLLQEDWGCHHAHRGEPLNEVADSLAAEAAKSDPARSIALDQDPEVVNFCLKGIWVEWDALVLEDLV